MVAIPRAFEHDTSPRTPHPHVWHGRDASSESLMENAVRITFWTVCVDWLLGEQYVPALLIMILIKRELLIQGVVDTELFFRRRRLDFSHAGWL